MQSLIISESIHAQTWEALGSGIGAGGTVYSIAEYNGDIYAGGSFTEAGGNSADNIARWDGTNWFNLGSGASGTVLAMAEYNGELYVGGDFTTGIEKWDGTNWLSVGGGMNGTVNGLIEYNGSLYAGGDFTTAGGNSANYIAKWNGTTWSAVGTGMSLTVNTLIEYNGALYVGGRFSTAGGSPAKYIACWNDTSWSSAPEVSTGTSPGIISLAVCNGYLYAAGGLEKHTGTSPSQNYFDVVGYFDGSGWTAVLSHAQTTYYTVPKDDVVIQGYGPALYSAEFDYSHYIFNNGINTSSSLLVQNSNSSSGGIRALTVSNGSLYMGGAFTSIDGYAGNNILKYTDSSVTGVANLNSSSVISTYPNPAQSILNIESSSNSPIQHIKLYNILGALVYTSKENSEKITVNVEDFKTGIYTIEVTTAKDVYKNKVIVR